MNKKAIPFAIASSVYEIPFSFYKENGIKHILLDLDNTLACYKDKLPSEKAKKLIQSLKENGYEVAIASNNTNKRVLEFAKELGIPAYCALRKPFSGPLKSLMRKEGFSKEDTVLIGDQILTDVYAANGAGVRAILCKPLTELDPLWTRVNRFFSKKKMKQLYQEPYKKLWREIP